MIVSAVGDEYGVSREESAEELEALRIVGGLSSFNGRGVALNLVVVMVVVVVEGMVVIYNDMSTTSGEEKAALRRTCCFCQC